MRFRLLKLRFRRRMRRQRHQVEDFGQQAERQLEEQFFQRLGSLIGVRRFVISWVLLFVLIIGCLVVQVQGLGNHYQTLKPVPGGIYTEGILGSFTNANPLYSTSEVDTTVSRLLFASLLKYDRHNKLIGDLAESWQVNADGTLYTVILKPGLSWHDGQPLTAADVAFTYKAIQNPDAQSPLYNSWRDIEVAATNPRTVTFKLPNPLSSFPYNLTNGIVPEHVLRTVPTEDLRSSDFNTKQPIGSGPFTWQAAEVIGTNPDDAQQLIKLAPFEKYHDGSAKLRSFVVHTFVSESQMLKSYRDKDLTALVGLSGLPKDIADDPSTNIYDMRLTASTMVFFKTTSGVLSDSAVRRALVTGTDVGTIIGQLDYYTRRVDEPFLKGQLGYDARYAQITGKPDAAQAELDKAGWRNGEDGIRHKNGQSLAFTLYTNSKLEYRMVAESLRKQWRNLGADVKLELQSNEDFHNTLSTHAYEAVLHSVPIGADPDVFVYWDSSQGGTLDQKLNLSEYRSSTADAALEAGRTRLNPELRTIKYRPFLQSWQKDAPALGLYQPRFLYVTRVPVYGLSDQVLNIDTDRFSSVEDWMIRRDRVTN